MKLWTAQEIKCLRLKLGWSAAELARRLCCSMQMITEWERGSDFPSPDECLKLERLEFDLEDYSQKVHLESYASQLFSITQVEQICQTEIRQLNKDL